MAVKFLPTLQLSGDIQ